MKMYFLFKMGIQPIAMFVSHKVFVYYWGHQNKKPLDFQRFIMFHPTESLLESWGPGIMDHGTFGVIRNYPWW